MHHRHIILNLSGPTVSARSGIGPKDQSQRNPPNSGHPFGSARTVFRSAITGLVGNALGYRREEGDRLNRLQSRLILATAFVRGDLAEDFQTSELHADDQGWTTRGRPEGRRGGAGTYQGRHIRRRQFWADGHIVVALRLEPADEVPTLDDVCAALIRPARPLFLGRKTDLPAGPILGEADRRAATCIAAVREAAPDALVYVWPASEGADRLSGDLHAHEWDPADGRDWRNTVHVGAHRLYVDAPGIPGDPLMAVQC